MDVWVNKLFIFVETNFDDKDGNSVGFFQFQLTFVFKIKILAWREGLKVKPTLFS